MAFTVIENIFHDQVSKNEGNVGNAPRQPMALNVQDA